MLQDNLTRCRFLGRDELSVDDLDDAIELTQHGTVGFFYFWTWWLAEDGVERRKNWVETDLKEEASSARPLDICQRTLHSQQFVEKRNEFNNFFSTSHCSGRHLSIGRRPSRVTAPIENSPRS